jgi:dienelactone hydrolase
MKDRVFGPVGMASSTLRPTMAMTRALSQGHEMVNKKIAVLRPAPDNAANWPAGSTFSNLSDLSRFVIAMMNDGKIDGKQVLSPQVVTALTTPHTDIPGSHSKYGYGLELASCSMPFGQTPKLPDISYDPQAPLAFQQSPVKEFPYARLLDISYDSPRGGRVNAYAVIPTGVAHPAGIVWQHWGQGDRSSMIPEAMSMARRGAASILINSPANRPNPPQSKTPEEGLALWLQDAVDIRRAADVLVQSYGVPVTRLAYVGHSYGATLGGVLAAGERRFRSLVLMGGFASISESILHPKTGPPGDKRLAEVYAAMDAERFIGQAAPAALFLQFARYDRFITEQQANRYAKAASTPKLVRWYDCGHEFNDPQSIADREDWLAQQLSLAAR